jgi:hypothetical protein
MFVIYLLLIAAAFAGLWKVFEKMGRPGWEGIIPIYNVYILLQMTHRPPWWLVGLIIPLVNIFLLVIICLDVAKGFNKSTGFAIGMALLGFVFWPLLGFGDDRWQGLSPAQVIQLPIPGGNPAAGT